MKKTILVFGASLGFINLANAVVYSFQSQGGTFDNNTSAMVMLMDGAESATMTVSSTGGDMNSNASGLGVNDANISNGESITILFNKDVKINYLDLSGVGSNTADSANLKFGSAADFEVHTGQPVGEFNGSTDIYTPATPIDLVAGDSIVITASSPDPIFDIEAISVTITPVPEPSSTLLFGLGSLALLTRRRK